MSKNERIRDKYPLFQAYGGKHEFLDTDAAVESTVEGRIRSVWPFIVRRVLSFERSLKPRERANYDVEDIVAELWVALATKDKEWTPDRGKYITYAGVIIDRELCAIRDKARTVHSPRNSSCRMKKYRAEEAAGEITPRRAKTAADIRRTGSNTQDLDDHGGGKPKVTAEPVAILAMIESKAENLDAVKLSIRKFLSPLEAMVMGRLCGLWGQPAASVWLIAWETGRDQGEIRRAKDRAVLKIRKHLAAIQHPVFNNRN